MRPIYILFIALAMNLLPGTSFAEDRYDCVLRCSAEKDTRNIDCPSSSGSSANSNSARTQAQCMQASEAAYINCFRRCPPPLFSPSAASGKQNSSPSPTGY